MSNSIEFVAAATALSFVLTYAWWLRFRVWDLRRDLFEIRDNLWEQMLSKNELDTEPYCEFRESLNSLIRVAPLLSIVSVLRLFFEREELVTLFLKNRDSYPELAEARKKVFRRVTKYLLFETISGLAISVFALLFLGLGTFRRTISRRIMWLFDAHAFLELDKKLSAVTSEHLGSI